MTASGSSGFWASTRLMLSRRTWSRFCKHATCSIPGRATWPSELSLGRLAAHVYHSQQRPTQPPSDADKVAARDTLLAIVSREKDRIDACAEQVREEAEIRSSLVPETVGVDLSPEGERMKRYETTCDRSMWRAIDEVNRRRGPAGYQLPRSAWLPVADDTTDSSAITERIGSLFLDDDDSSRKIKAPLRNEATEASRVAEASTRAEMPRADGPPARFAKRTHRSFGSRPAAKTRNLNQQRLLHRMPRTNPWLRWARSCETNPPPRRSRDLTWASPGLRSTAGRARLAGLRPPSREQTAPARWTAP